MAREFKISGKNLGKDCSIVITDSLGNQYHGAELMIVTDFEVNCDYTKSVTKSIINGGKSYYESIPHSAKVSLKGVRYNGALEDMESIYRTNFENGVHVTYTIQYQVVNRDGSVNTRQVTGAKPSDFNLGKYSGDKDVDQSVMFEGGTLRNNS